MAHSLSRTSPKGGPFIGTCIKCGMTDIPLSRINEPCTNPANLSQSDALAVAIGAHDTETKQ
jgi:hypothetical protein